MGIATEFQEHAEQRVFEEWLRDTLGKVSGEKIDVAAQVYDRIQKETNPQRAFRYFLENADEIESTKEEEVEQVFTATEVQQLRRKCDELIDGILKKILLENDQEQEFYDRLWTEGICGNTFLQSDREKIYAFCRIWQDSRIPYFHLEKGMMMTNESFSACGNKNKALIKKAFFIISSAFSQRSEQSDLLLRVLDECETNEDKVVVMAQILGKVERKAWMSLYEATRSAETEN
ncbi:MAG: hypothetical protein NC254_10535 [bacterium]|nr:hypothetical protein [bacterium]